MIPASHRTEYSYDLNGQLIRVKNPDGGIQRTVYDKLGRKVQEISPNQYVASSDVAVDTYAEAVGTRYAYNDKGNLDTVTTPDDGVTKYTYDIYGNILTETLPNGAIHTYSYDVMDRLIKTTFKENATASEVQLYAYSYGKLDNGKSQRTEIKYLNESETATTVSVYDFAGRLVEVQYPNGSKSKTEYNGDGTVAKETATNGAITSYVYDDYGRLSGVYKPMSVENGGTKYSYTAFAYDKNGNKTEEKKGNELVLLGSLPATSVNQYYEYNSDDTLKRIYDQDGSETRYTYDQEGNLESQTTKLNDTEEQVQQFVYGFGGRKLEETLIASADDFYGVVTDGALKTTFTYDKNGNLLTMTPPNGVTTTYTYDVMNRMLKQSQPGFDEHGAPVTLTESKTYDISGNVLTTTDAKGNLTTYVYDAQNRCIKTIDALGGTTFSTYDRAGRKTAEVLPSSYDSEKSLDQMARTEYLYGNMDQVIAVTLKYNKLTYNPFVNDWTGTWTETVTKAFKYDNSLRVIKELSGEGYAAGAGSTVQDKITNGYGTETTYNLAGLPLTIRDAATKVAGLVSTMTYTYDAQGRKVTETNAKNHIISYTYDDAGNLTQFSLNGTVQKSSTYDLANRLITSRDGNNNTTQFKYNKLGKIKEVIYPGDTSIDANTAFYKYDTMGNLVYDVNSMGKKTLSTFDALGRQTNVTVKDGEDRTLQNKTVVYDVLGNVRFETDPNGQVTETTYDALSRPVTKSTAVSGNVKITIYTYDANSNPLTTTNWLGNTSELIYDALNRVVGKRDAHGKIVETLEYDLNNAQISSVDALGQETIYKYDVNGRRIETQDAEGNVTKVDYDVLGNVIGETDGLGNKKRYEYDAAARLTAVVNALGEKTLYTYDAAGNMLTQTDGNGNTTAFTYNVMNKMEKRMDPLSAGEMPHIESMTYYADGSVKSKVDRNEQSTLFTYDALGRMLSQTVGSTSIGYTYDGIGNTLTMTDQTGMTTWTYDSQGRALTKAVPHIGTSTYDYDLVTGIAGLGAGEYAERTTDPKGNVTLKIYDKMDRVISVDDGLSVTRFTYYDNGSRQSIIYPDGSSETYVYDANNQNTALVNRKADNSLIDTYSYTYDAANNQTSKTDSKGTTTFEYDKLNRISTVTEPSGIKTVYAFDKAGNRTSEKKIVGEAMMQETLYKYDASNRLLTTETKSQVLGTTDKVTYTYDANGNMLSQKTTSIKPAEIGNQATFVLEKSGASPNTLTQYTYDVFNQLKTSDDGTHKSSYAYNGIGYRVEKSVTTGPKESPVTSTSRYLYEYDKVVLEVDGAGNLIGRNTYGTNLLSREMAGNKVYYMYNGHGDVTALLNTAGDIVATYYYDIWGNIVEKMESALVSNPFRYAGYQYDEETGLYYLNARYYDAKIARFLTEDTYRGRQNDPLSLNIYTYCLNNPIQYSDPTGHIAAALYEADGNVRTNVSAGTAKNQSVSSTNTNNSQITNDSTKNKYEAEKEKAEREKVAKLQKLQKEKEKLQREKEAREKADRDKRAKESNEILKNQEKNKPKNNVKPALNNITSLTTGSMGAGCSVSVVREGKSYEVYYTEDNYKSRETALNVGLYTSMAAGLGVAVGIAGGVVVVAETISASALLPDAQLDMNSFTTNVAAGNIAGAYVDAIALMIPGVNTGGLSAKIDDVVEVGSGVKLDAYKNMVNDPSVTGQAHHLSQDAAFKAVIPKQEGLSIELNGNAFTDVGSQHYNAHNYLEGFWNNYRKGGDLFNTRPTVGEYNRALFGSLENAGLSKSDSAYSVLEAFKQQRGFGLSNTDLVPRIPGRINQVQ